MTHGPTHAQSNQAIAWNDGEAVMRAVESGLSQDELLELLKFPGVPKGTAELANLILDIDAPSIECISADQVYAATLTFWNLGTADAGPFEVRANYWGRWYPNQFNSADGFTIAGLAAGASITWTLQSSPFDPLCIDYAVVGWVDLNNDVAESNESDNILVDEVRHQACDRSDCPGTPTSTATRTATQTSTSTPVPPTSTPTVTASLTPTTEPTATATDQPTSTQTPTSTATATSVPPTATASSTKTPTNTATETSTRTATATKTPTSTQTPVPPTATSTPSKTKTPTSTATATATETSTNTAKPTKTPTSTRTPTSTATATATETSTRTAKPTKTPTASSTATAEPTATSTLTSSPTPTETSTAQPTATATVAGLPDATVWIELLGNDLEILPATECLGDFEIYALKGHITNIGSATLDSLTLKVLSVEDTELLKLLGLTEKDFEVFANLFGKEYEDVLTGPLGPGQERVWIVRNDPFDSICNLSYGAIVIVDPDNIIEEEREDNNQAGQAFLRGCCPQPTATTTLVPPTSTQTPTRTATPSPTQTPTTPSDLFVSDAIARVEAGCLEDNRAYQVEVVFQLVGDASVAFSATVEVFGQVYEVTRALIVPNSSATWAFMSAPFEPVCDTTYTIEVIVDPFNELVETNEDNNVFVSEPFFACNCSPTQTPTHTATLSPTRTPTATRTPTSTATPTLQPSSTRTPTATLTATPSLEPTATATQVPGTCDSGYYLLDHLGGRHPVGQPPVITGPLYFGAHNIARDLERASNTVCGSTEDLVVLDKYGVNHFVSNSECSVSQDFYLSDLTANPNNGAAVDLVVSKDTQGIWVLASTGRIYRAGTAEVAGEESELIIPAIDGLLGWDVPTPDVHQNLPEPLARGATLRAVSLVVIDAVGDSRAEGYLIFDSQGGRYQVNPDGSLVAPGSYSELPSNHPYHLLDPADYVFPFFPGLDILRDAEPFPGTMEGLVIFDGWGGIHPVPVDDTSNAVFYTRNEDPLTGEPITTVGMPYIVSGFDDPFPHRDEIIGIDAASIFADLEFSAGCPGSSFYTLDRFGGVFTFGASRRSPNDVGGPFEGSPYFFPYHYAKSIEIFEP